MHFLLAVILFASLVQGAAAQRLLDRETERTTAVLIVYDDENLLIKSILAGRPLGEPTIIVPLTSIHQYIGT